MLEHLSNNELEQVHNALSLGDKAWKQLKPSLQPDSQIIRKIEIGPIEPLRFMTYFDSDPNEVGALDKFIADTSLASFHPVSHLTTYSPEAFKLDEPEFNQLVWEQVGRSQMTKLRERVVTRAEQEAYKADWEVMMEEEIGGNVPVEMDGEMFNENTIGFRRMLFYGNYYLDDVGELEPETAEEFNNMYPRIFGIVTGKILKYGSVEAFTQSLDQEIEYDATDIYPSFTQHTLSYLQNVKHGSKEDWQKFLEVFMSGNFDDLQFRLHHLFTGVPPIDDIDYLDEDVADSNFDPLSVTDTLTDALDKDMIYVSSADGSTNMNGLNSPKHVEELIRIDRDGNTSTVGIPSSRFHKPDDTHFLSNN